MIKVDLSSETPFYGIDRMGYVGSGKNQTVTSLTNSLLMKTYTLSLISWTTSSVFGPCGDISESAFKLVGMLTPKQYYLLVSRMTIHFSITQFALGYFGEPLKNVSSPDY